MRGRRLLAALVGALILALAASTVTAAMAGGPGATSAAKKKCKKKNKKKCKKKAGALPVLPIPPIPVAVPRPPAPAPPPEPDSTHIDSVTLSWNETEDVDLDLHIWNSDGGHAGADDSTMMMEQDIDFATHLGDHRGTGPQFEDFTDTDGDNHLITIGVCYWDATPSVPTADWTITVRYTDGDIDTLFPSPGNPFDVLKDTHYITSSAPDHYIPTQMQLCYG